ncbi:MAG: glycosyltransferase family protein, partial [Acidimicrobiales bacterium]
MKRILVYSHDTYGLGNIRRTLTIAEHMIEAYDDVSILIVSGSPMLHAFRVTPRLDYVKLPCLTRLTGGGYGVKALGLSYEATIRMRSRLLTATVAEYRPDVIVVDKKPFGVDEELADALDLAHRGPDRPRLALLLRDILDAPHKTAAIWRKNGYYEAVRRYYDTVLVLGTASVFDLSAEYDFPPDCAHRVQYCGYLRRRPGLRSREEVRAELGVVPGAAFVLLTPGGGEDGAALARTYLVGLAAEGGLAGAAPGGVRTLLVTGPEMARTEQDELRRRAGLLDGVDMLEFTADLLSYVGAADLLVSMGGYNTVCELLSARRRAVVVPRVR